MLRGPRSQGTIVNSLSPAGKQFSSVGGVPAEPGRWSDNLFLCKPPRRFAPPLHRGELKKHFSQKLKYGIIFTLNSYKKGERNV